MLMMVSESIQSLDFIRLDSGSESDVIAIKRSDVIKIDRQPRVTSKN